MGSPFEVHVRPPALPDYALPSARQGRLFATHQAKETGVQWDLDVGRYWERRKCATVRGVPAPLVGLPLDAATAQLLSEDGSASLEAVGNEERLRRSECYSRFLTRKRVALLHARIDDLGLSPRGVSAFPPPTILGDAAPETPRYVPKPPLTARTRPVRKGVPWEAEGVSSTSGSRGSSDDDPCAVGQ